MWYIVDKENDTHKHACTREIQKVRWMGHVTVEVFDGIDSQHHTDTKAQRNTNNPSSSISIKCPPPLFPTLPPYHSYPTLPSLLVLFKRTVPCRSKMNTRPAIIDTSTLPHDVTITHNTTTGIVCQVRVWVCGRGV